MNKHTQKFSVDRSRQRHELLFAVAIIVVFFLSLAQPVRAQAATAELDAQRKTELIYLLKQDCGSCHGMTLKGGLGPTLLPQVMATRDAKLLRTIILDGVPDTPMPPWRGLLSHADITYLIELLQKGVPHD